jgi:hypothetical protein
VSDSAGNESVAARDTAPRYRHLRRVIVVGVALLLLFAAATADAVRHRDGLRASFGDVPVFPGSQRIFEVTAAKVGQAEYGWEYSARGESGQVADFYEKSLSESRKLKDALARCYEREGQQLRTTIPTSATGPFEFSVVLISGVLGC